MILMILAFGVGFLVGVVTVVTVIARDAIE